MSEVQIYKSKWQLKKDETFKVKFLLDESPDKPRITIISEDSEEEDIVSHWVEFRMWSFHMMVEIRKKATKYYKDSGSFYVDNDLFNDYKVRYLLKDWSFAQIDPHMKLFHKDGILLDESFVMFKNLYPWVVRSILTKMNAVLEGYED